MANKTVKNGKFWIAGAFVVVIAVLFGGFAYLGSIEQAAIGEVPLAPVESETGVSAELFGKSASLSIAAFDVEQDTSTQVNSTYYFWINEVYGGSSTTGASSRVSMTDSSVGDTVKIVAFDATYPYGTIMEKLVEKQSGDLWNLEVSSGSTAYNLTLYDEDNDAISVDSNNVTIGATNYIADKLRIKNEDDKSVFDLCAIGFGTVSASNVSDVKVSGLTASTAIPKRYKDTVDYIFEFDTKRLNDDDTRYDTGAVTIVPDGDNLAETMTVYMIDCGMFITVDNQLGTGIQTDALNPAETALDDQSLDVVIL